MSQWHYEVNGAQQGPVDESKIKEMAASGTITGNTRVWKEGMADWASARETELASAIPSGPPPLKSSGPPPMQNQNGVASQGSQSGQVANQRTGAPAVQKSPGLNAVGGFLLPGVPQMMAGQGTKGIVLLVVAFLGMALAGLGVVVCIVSSIDAYKVALRYNVKGRIDDWEFFPSIDS